MDSDGQKGTVFHAQEFFYSVHWDKEKMGERHCFPTDLKIEKPILGMLMSYPEFGDIRKTNKVSFVGASLLEILYHNLELMFYLNPKEPRRIFLEETFSL